MITIPVLDSVTGNKVDEVEFSENKLGGTVRKGLLREAILMYEANKHIGTSSAKTRSEVSGSNRKPWRQKGTGRARAGHKRSPMWRGGAVVHGPRPRNRKYQIPKSAKRNAVQSALLAKCLDDHVVIVDQIDFPEIKTKQVEQLLDLLNIYETVLIGIDPFDPVILKSARNIPGVKVRDIRLLNAFDVLVSNQLLFPKDAFLRLIGEGSAEEPEPAAVGQASESSDSEGTEEE